jgi:YbgC/YbaW family acyl-CoA thioester hydrolase
VPRVFWWRAPVWQADVDAFGEVRASTLLRFLQETATRASTDAGFDPAYYARTGTMWLVRRSTLTLAAPARYGDELEARTWIVDFRRVRSQRAYEVRAGDLLVARADTDWVYVDRTGRPRRIPSAMESTFVPEGAPALERPPAPADTPPATAGHTVRRVELHELDALRHVNNAAYVHYVEQAALDAAAAAGWPLARQLEAGGRFRAVAHDLEYLDAALLDETLDVATWLDGIGADAVERRTLVARAGAARMILRAASRYVWTSADPAGDGAPRPMPESLRRALAGSLG